ncbi:MAG: adenylosuccinate lyase [Clostridiales bacterium]|jgi:adenylosuccinate lyase|nr:adenylosuccinate lyase [Clostridiales bacterium]
MPDRYEHPLCKRYASREMQAIFSDDSKFSTWRRLWVALAEAERELGLGITEEQIGEMRANVLNINYDVAARKEKELRHDVMAHIHAFGEQCPSARPIIHLGATSCYVGDNTDIILMRSALLAIKRLLLTAVSKLAGFAAEHRDLPTLAFTHFQPAQPTTVGKRATLWISDLMLDLEQVDFVAGRLKLLGCKGTTGTCASFLELFDGDHAKVLELERRIAAKMGFDAAYDVCGQTYPRKVDYFVLSALSGIAQSAQKFSNDIRLLSHLKEAEEPFEDGQIGSSAMAYKRNPMRCERMAALSRYLVSDAMNAALTAGAQWFERTLDDSANRRMSVPEAFLCADAILSLYINVAGGLKIYPKMIERHLEEELPFMLTENILMACVKKGGDRQALHEAIRRHANAAAAQVKQLGGRNDLLDRIGADPAFGLTRGELGALMSAKGLTGRAAEQTGEYLAKVEAALRENADLLGEPYEDQITV